MLFALQVFINMKTIEEPIELKRITLNTEWGQSLKDMMNDYRELQASDSVQGMIECVMDDALDHGTIPVDVESLMESYYIVDLIDDLRSLDPESLRTDKELCRGNDFNYAEEYSTISYYPRTQMTASSVLVFPFVEVSEKVASFISNISRSYAVKEDNNYVVMSSRGDGSGDTHFRVSIIACNSPDQATPFVQAIDFDDETDYWGFIAALSRAIVRKEEGTFGGWQGNCQINLNQDEEKNVITTLFGSQHKKTKVFVTQCEVIVADNGKQLFEVPLTRLKALTLSSDWPTTKEYVMNVELGESHHGEGVQTCLLDTNLEPVTKSSFYHTEMRPQAAKQAGSDGSTSVTYTTTQKVLLPISFEEVAKGVSKSGLTSVAVVDVRKARGEGYCGGH